MTPFIRLEAVAAPVPLANVDTDKILPGRFLKTTQRLGLREGLFASLRTDAEFVLNRPPWDRAGILIALDNFGCGSSREHAPWALLDFGIRCVIAPSIADIFCNNCCKNGILPISLERQEVATLMATVSDPKRASIAVDLGEQTISLADGRRFDFNINPGRKRDLMLGIDDIARSLQHAATISAFVQERHRIMPWLAPITPDAVLSEHAAPVGDRLNRYEK